MIKTHELVIIRAQKFGITFREEFSVVVASVVAGLHINKNKFFE